MQKKILSFLCVMSLCCGLSLPALADTPTKVLSNQSTVSETTLPQNEWQGQPAFPDWMEYVDDTLAANSLYSFTAFAGQGNTYITVADGVESFRLFVNHKEVDTTSMKMGKTYQLDISDFSKNGTNTLQVSNILPTTIEKAVTVSIPYPTVLENVPTSVGINEETLSTISDFMDSEIEYGFSGAQLAVIKDGNLVVNEAWGAKNGYTQDGTRIVEGDTLYDPVTTDTLYDLASNTKMYSVNYALQYMLSQEEAYDITLDDPISKFFPQFVQLNQTIFKDGTTEEQKAEIMAWKSELTIRDILKHQAGFDPDPQYHNDLYNQVTQKADPEVENELYSQDRETTLEKVLATPLIYEPGTETKYSDVDYMLLCFIIEEVTGQRIDTFLDEVFWTPMGLTHTTYNPLENGFTKEDVAATELNGNTRDGAISFSNIRTETIQGEVHDEKAYYAMDGISGHAGLFSNAEELARLAQLMLSGGEGENRFFSKDIMDQFTKPNSIDAPTWGLGWWRQGDMGRVNYFGTSASDNTVGHQGWTGTLTVIDPTQNLVIVLLTNKKNSPVIDNQENANDFYSDNLLLGSLGVVVDLVYDTFDGSNESVDAAVEQLAVERIRTLSEHKGTYDEAPHMNDAFAITDILLKRAEKRSTQELISSTSTTLDTLSQAVSENVENTENQANAEKWLESFKERTNSISVKKNDATSSTIKVIAADTVPLDTEAQRVDYFPSRLNKDDGTIATGNCYHTSTTKFQSYTGQGTLYFTTYREIPSIEIFVNGLSVDTNAMKNTVGNFSLDVSEYTQNGENIVQITGMPIDTPNTETERSVKMLSTNPEVVQGDLQTVELNDSALNLLNNLVENDIEEGFTSAQMAVIKDGQMVYSDAWGKTNSYLPDGTPNTESAEVTTDTLYDLASNTKMYSTNYAVQYLQAHSSEYNDFSISDPVTKYFPNFAEDVLFFNYELKNATGATDLETAKTWKTEILLSDLLQHQAGFAPDPQFHNDQYNQVTQTTEAGTENPLYAIGSENVAEAICKAPLVYEPGTQTVYSDVDYMLLGLIVEQVSGKSLDLFMKETFYEPMNLTHTTYNPLENGFTPEECAATELNGNTRDGVVSFTNIRTETIQGEVHDEKAYYAMNGVSGHAGLFSNAEDLARLAQVMLNENGYGENVFFDKNVNEYFTSPKDSSPTWGMGWWREAELGRVWYFGVESSRNTIGHQGWTGTLTLIDPSQNLVMVYLTNKINSPVTDPEENANKFDGNWYTASTLGIASSLVYEGLDSTSENSDEIQIALDALTGDMSIDHIRLVNESEEPLSATHPLVKSLYAMLDTQMENTEARPTLKNIEEMRTSISALDTERDAEEIATLNTRLENISEKDIEKEETPETEMNKNYLYFLVVVVGVAIVTYIGYSFWKKKKDND